ncbi:MAG: M14 metallopeptidase family protein [Acidobacteriota bacterium]
MIWKQCRISCWLLSALTLSVSARSLAQDTAEFWPGTRYDPSIPTIEMVLGYRVGDQITPPDGILRYLEALQASAPDRMKIVEYGRTWENRKLVYAALGSESNLRQLSAIRSRIQQLADPRKTGDSLAGALIEELPATVWFGYGVHGNEISSPDAALLTAYHLLAAREDPIVEEILTKVIVLIDPLQNPDGRSRFVHAFETALGLEPVGHPEAAEHNEPWPAGRTNHYFFDMNRDWFALTQPETRGRIKAMLEWYPLVFVDLHEMGSDATYYFAPGAAPHNPHQTKVQRESLELFGRANALWFDRFRFDYFTREVYDGFYPGYGDSWPSYYGSISMTYEQASVRGLVVQRKDGSVLRFRESVQHHFVACLATAQAVAANRKKLLQDFYSYRKSAVQEGQTEAIRTYVLSRRGNTAAVDKLAAVLAAQGVEILEADTAFRIGGQDIPKGSYVIPLSQPSKRLVRTLLDPQVPIDEAFLKEQERRRKKKLPDEIYDVTAWSLPLLYNVEALATKEVPSVATSPANPTFMPRGTGPSQKATLAYLVPWGTDAAGRLLTASLRADLRVFSTDKAFTQSGRRFPAGTLIYKVADNPTDLHDRLQRLAEASGAEVLSTNTAWVEEGVNFGSRHVVLIPKPSVALAWDTPTQAYSAGSTRFVLERQFGYPVTPIRTPQLARADLSRFQVLILPNALTSEGYRTALGTEGIRRLKEWVTAGGTLIGLAGAVSFLAEAKTGLLSVSQENVAQPDQPDRGATESKGGSKVVSGPETKEAAAGPDRVAGKILKSTEDLQSAIQADAELPDKVPGALLRARIDEDHWVTAGVPQTVNVLLMGQAIFSPIKLDKGTNAAFFESAAELVASGHLWEENRKQLAFKPFVIVQPQGRGMVIAFTADPTFRAYMEGLNLLFLNAVFRGPAHTRRTPEIERGFLISNPVPSVYDKVFRIPRLG